MSGEKRWAGLVCLAVLAGVVVAVLWGGRESSAAAGSQDGRSETTRTIVTAQELEDGYGLRVNVLALTAAGGMIDLRLRILDKAKAAALLGHRNPTLRVDETGLELKTAEAGQPQDDRLARAPVLFLLFPNSGNAVTRGTGVSVSFGDVSLTPVAVQ